LSSWLTDGAGGDHPPAPGLRVIRSFRPVRVAARGGRRCGGLSFVRARGDSPALADARDKYPSVIAGWSVDLPVDACPSGCDVTGRAVGHEADVRRLLGVGGAGVPTGKGVRVAVVDGGIDGRIVPVAGGFCHSARPGFVPGAGPVHPHGTMVGYDVRLAAPDCRLLDFRLLTPGNSSGMLWLSDAVAHFARLLELLDEEPGPLVANNSWSVYDLSGDLPAGDPARYCDNPAHAVNALAADLAAEGVDLVFAAGNCGSETPERACGAADRGPGRSIHGVNSHPDVLTVAAVTVGGDRAGCSSQGPGLMHAAKPDLAAYAQFVGSHALGSCDSGTSAACGVASGAVAALREVHGPDRLTPGALRDVLRRTCRGAAPLPRSDVGAGAIDLAAAAAAAAGAGTP
jgi:subtilisin family serine protease